MLVKFISGDGVEHEVQHDCIAADVMRANGFQTIGEHPSTVYTEADAIEQNDGDDVSKKDPTPAAAPAAKKPAAAKKPKKPAAKKAKA